MTFADDLGDLVTDDFGEATRHTRLERDDNPPWLGHGVDRVAFAEGHGILEAPVEHPVDVGDEDLAVLRGVGFLGVKGHTGPPAKDVPVIWCVSWRDGEERWEMVHLPRGCWWVGRIGVC